MVYPAWKKVVWRFVRVFVASFLVQVGTGLINLESWDAVKGLLLSALSASVVALGKAIREWFKEDHKELYENVVKKLIF